MDGQQSHTVAGYPASFEPNEYMTFTRCEYRVRDEVRSANIRDSVASKSPAFVYMNWVMSSLVNVHHAEELIPRHFSAFKDPRFIENVESSVRYRIVHHVVNSTKLPVTQSVSSRVDEVIFSAECVMMHPDDLRQLLYDAYRNGSENR